MNSNLHLQQDSLSSKNHFTRIALKVNSNNVQEDQNFFYAEYIHKNSNVKIENENKYTVNLEETTYEFKTDKKLPKLGVMLVGLAGNNGSTLVGGIFANKHNITWNNKKGLQKANYLGSITQSSTTKIGNTENQEIYILLKDILPMVSPNDFIISGWDINNENLLNAMKRAQVFDYELQEKLKPYTESIHPLPGIYYKDFIAANQEERANNVIPGESKMEHLNTIRKNIRDFKQENKLDKVIVFWTGNTERFTKIEDGIHNTAKNLFEALEHNHSEISASTVYAIGSILEGCSFINGSPQNTFVPGVFELARQKNVFIVGNDFKSGQTKFKTAVTEFLVHAGIKPLSIVSYNHLGNNDGRNLSSESQFKSKEKSKSSCVDDILGSTKNMYEKNEHIDHCVVIKYVPNAGDTKKAIDEYSSNIFMNGTHILESYNMCEDSLLAVPLMIDLVILTEMFERIEMRKKVGPLVSKKEKIHILEDQENFNPNQNLAKEKNFISNNNNGGTINSFTKKKPMQDKIKAENNFIGKSPFKRIGNVLDILGYLLKAPETELDLPVVNSLSRQRNCIENFLKICAGLPIEDNMLLNFRLKSS